MKRNNRGISLIVLVITVIVMIILAGSVIISLSNSVGYMLSPLTLIGEKTYFLINNTIITINIYDNISLTTLVILNTKKR